MEQKKSKSLIVGIVSAVVVLVVLLALVLTQCVGGMWENEDTAVPAVTQEESPTYELYWNLDRAEYAGKSEAGMSSRMPEDDGYFHVRFFFEGEEVTLKVADRKLINAIDVQDIMGLEFDDDGIVVGVLNLDELPLNKVGWQFYVESAARTAIKLNSSDNMDGMVIMLDDLDPNRVWDMTGISGPAGTVTEAVTYDRVLAITNLDGQVTHVFIIERTNYFLTHEAECQHCKETVTWYEWTRETDLPTRTGHYQLMKDVQLEGQHNMGVNVKLCLDLNGHTINGMRDARVISMQKTDTELALMDASEEKTGRIAGHGTIGQGGVVWVRNGNFYMYGGTLDGSDVIGTNGTVSMVNSNRYFYLYDGTIIGGIARAQAMETAASGFGYGAGGALYIRGTMRMYGGTIRDGRAEAGYNYKKGKLTVNRGFGGNIFLYSGAVFEIQDGQILNGYAGNMGGNIYADGTAEIIISGGTISGGRNDSRVKDRHGGNIVTGTKTTVTMSGGIISGGVNSNGAGGNMYLNGIMTMTGGVVTGGRGTSGGNIHMGNHAVLNLYGGIISGGYAKNYGGNVNVSGQSTLCLQGGAILGGVADGSGGNINCFSEGTFRMTAGTLSDGVAKGEASGNGGGNIYLRSDKTKVEIFGGTISGGKAEGAVAEDGTVTGGYGGNINISRGIVNISGGVITGGEANGYAGGIYVGTKSSGMTLSGNARIYGNGIDIVRSTSNTAGKSQIVIDGWKGNGDKGKLVIDRIKGVAGSVLAVPVEGNALTEEILELFDSARRFLPLGINDKGQMILAKTLQMGEADHTHCLCGDKIEGHSCTDTGFVSVTADEFMECFSYHDKAYYVLGNANLCLTEDIILTAPCFSAGYELSICLHGHTITMKNEGRLTSNGTTGVLNITDCTGKGIVKADASRTGSLMTVYKGTMNIYGGTFDASAIKLGTTNTGKVGAVVHVRDANDKLAMYGGKLIGGEVYRGGAVYVDQGIFEMYDGEITGGVAELGGNVAVNKGSFRMYDGKIYGGTATSGAGVHIGANAKNKTLLLTGDAMIYGNGTEDVYLGSATGSDNYLTLDGWNGNGENAALKLNCRAAGIGSVVAVAKEGVLTEEDLFKFSYISDTLTAELKDGKIVLTYVTDHEHCLCNDTMEHTCEKVRYMKIATAEEFKALFDKDNFLLGDTNVVLTGDITLDSQYYSNGHIWNLCLNGHTLTMTEKARLTANKISGVLNITDCGEAGKILAAEGCRETLVNTNSGIVNLYGGIIDASAIRLGTEGSTVGAAVSIGQAVDQFNMYGGKLVGGQVSRGGTLYVYKGSAKIYGGEITGGEAANGGNVSVNFGSLELYGGKIYGGTATNGAGVHIGANAKNKTLLLTGNAMIYGNGTEDVYLGSATAAHNYLTLDGWKGNGENGALVLGCRGAAADSVVAIAKEGQLTEETLQLLSYPHDQLKLALKDGKAVLVPSFEHEHCICNGQLDHTCADISFVSVATAEEFKNLFDEDRYLLADANVVLTGDITLDSQYYSNGHIWNLCLNGHTITMTEKARLTANKISGVLNITDCGEAGKILAAEGCRETLVNTNSGIVNLYGGIIDASAIRLGTEGSTVGAAISIGQAVDQFNMYGGKLVGGQVSRGGTLYIYKGSAKIYGGEITGGEAANGGNVSVNFGSLELYGGKIYGGTATNGAGVHIGANAKNKTLLLTGNAMIYGNGTEDVYLGSATASDNYLTLDGWKGNGENGALVLGCRGAAADSVVAIAKEGQLTEETLQLLSYPHDQLKLALKDGKAVLVPSFEHEHCICNGQLDHTCADISFVSVATAEEFKNLFDEDRYLLADANVVLTGDITLDSQYYSNGHIWNLCLNGHTLTMTEKARLTANKISGVLNITDCGEAGKILAAEGCRETLVNTNSGIVNLYGGIIDASAIRLGTEGSTVGAAVSIGQAVDQFNMYGGKLVGGQVSRGGTLYVNKGSAKIYGGEITGGEAANGGNVSVNFGSLELYGGKIYGGTATSGAGVHIGANAKNKTLLISGDAMIYGNGTEDVYLGSATASDNYLTLDGWKGNGENGALVLGCRGAAADSVVAIAKEGQLTEETLQLLSYPHDQLKLALKDGKAVLVPSFEHEHCICNGQLDHTCADISFVSVATAEEFKNLFDEDRYLLGDTNIVLTGDITLDSQYYSNGHIWNLCLNGHTLTMTEKARLIANKTSGVLNITDCGENGKILAAEGCRETLVNTNLGVLNLYSGVIDASAIRLGTGGSTVGAAVSMGQEMDQFHMYGGKLVGGQVNRGGTLYVYKGSAKIYGGEITGGGAANGGNISVNFGSLELYGGKVYGGTATSGAGVHIGANAKNKTLLLTGNAMIYGNGTEDVYLGSATGSDNYLTLDGWNGNGANAALQLNCRGAGIGSAVAVAKEGTLTEEDLFKFSYADSTYVLELKEGKAVLAEPPVPHVHCLCDGELTTGCAHDKVIFTEISTAEEFKTLFDEDNYLLGDTNIVLTGDITLDSQYYSNGHIWNLCLNGHTLTMTEKGRLTANKTSGVLNITDCGENGKILAAEGCRETLVNTNLGVLNLYSGVIDASAIRLGTGGSTVGAAVSMGQEMDQFHMYGGKLVGGQVNRGGTLYVYKGSAKIYGGEITGGGAANGGNISVNFGSLELYGGKVYGGTATSGAGVHIGANAKNKTLLLTGNAMIYGNGTEDVYLGSATGSDNYLTLDGWNGNGANAALQLNCRGAGIGSAVAVAKEGTLTEEDLFKFSYADSTYVLELKEGKAVLAEPPVPHEHCLCGGELTTGCAHDKVIFTEISTAEEFKTLFDEDNYLLGDTNIVLTGDITLDSRYYSNGYIWNLCLNGHTITMTEKGRLTANKTSGVLNITDCGENGKILAAEGCAETLVNTNNGVLNLYGGVIDASAIRLGTEGSTVGAAVSIGQAVDQLNMYGGKLVGGQVSRGGTLYIYKGSAKIYGGEITGGEAANGGNVSVNFGSLELYGGKIYGGTATNGAGVHIGANAKNKTLLLTGNAMIYGNGTEDVYLGSATGSDNYLTLDGWNGNGANAALQLNCRGAGIGSAVAVAKEGTLTEEDLFKFSYADSTYVLELKEGKAVLAEPPVPHEHCLCGGELTTGCAHDKVIFTEISTAEAFKTLFDEDNYLLGDTNIVLTGDITLDSQYYSNGHIWNLCLNGHTLTMTGTARLIANKTSGVLNITDCGEAGKILAAEGCRETLVNTNSGIVNLYGGIIDASAIRLGTEGSTVGAAVSIGQAVDQFNMYGGKLVGGQVNRGGTLYVYRGSAKIYDGEITGGEATNGGNVSVNFGSLELYGGKIYGGTATNGAGVHIGANAKNKTLLLTGNAMIYGNGTEDVYLGSATASHNYLTLDGWNGNGENAALKLNCRAAGIGSVVAVAKEGALTEEDLSKFSYADSTYVLALEEGKAVLAEPPVPHEHCLCGGELTTGCAHDKVIFTEIATAEEFKALFDADNYLLDDTNIVLTGDITLDSQYYSNGHIWNLCLNGHTLTMTGTARLTANKTSGVLNITDCGENGKILAAEGCRETLVNTDNGILNLYGGVIDASAIRLGTGGSTVGAAVSMGQEMDQFHMYGGKLVGGEVYRGGTVFVNQGTFEMYNGEITGGTADLGGNVAVNKGSFLMYGGKVYGGTATSGAGVHIGANAKNKTLLISGDAMIYGNGTEDVYLGSATASDNYLTLDGWNGNGENGALVLGCRGAAADSVVAIAKEGELTQADAAKIIYSDENLISELAEGKLVLRAYHRHCLCANTLQEGCDHSKLIFTEIASADAFLEAVLAEGTETVNIVLTESFTLTGSQYIKGKTVNLCLNGQTLTMSGAKLIAQNGAVLNITACNGGEIKAGTKTSRQMLYAHTGGGQINLYAGTVNAGAVEDFNTNKNGGAVQIMNDTTGNAASTFTMYGGKIIGGKVYRGGAVYVDSGKFVMRGGEITEGRSTNGGAGVCVNTGHMEMSGGTITGCVDSTTSTPKLGGGVCMLTNADSITLSGTAKIYGNTSGGVANDLYIGNKSKTAFYLILDQWEGNGKDENEEPRGLHFSTHKDKTAGAVIAQAKEGQLTAEDLAKLSYTGGTYALELNAEGKIALKTK